MQSSSPALSSTASTPPGAATPLPACDATKEEMISKPIVKSKRPKKRGSKKASREESPLVRSQFEEKDQTTQVMSRERLSQPIESHSPLAREPLKENADAGTEKIVDSRIESEKVKKAEHDEEEIVGVSAANGADLDSSFGNDSVYGQSLASAGEDRFNRIRLIKQFLSLTLLISLQCPRRGHPSRPRPRRRHRGGHH